MRVLVVGVGRRGAEVLKQLQKNPKIRIVTLDPREDPYAIQQGIITRVDIRESLDPLTLQSVVEKARPDLVLLTAATQDLELGTAPAVDILAEALRGELAALSNVPVIQVA